MKSPGLLTTYHPAGHRTPRSKNPFVSVRANKKLGHFSFLTAALLALIQIAVTHSANFRAQISPTPDADFPNNLGSLNRSL